LDGDLGVILPNVVVGAPFSDLDNVEKAGAVFILFLQSGGTVSSHKKINSGALVANELFGTSVASLGDVDGDSVVDIAVGSSGGTAVWFICLAVDGTTKSSSKIDASSANFPGTLTNTDKFGQSIASLGNFNGESNQLTLAVTSPQTTGLSTGKAGSVWIIDVDFGDVDQPAIGLNVVEIGHGDVEDAPLFVGPGFYPYDFGRSIAHVFLDGKPALAVGSTTSDVGGLVYILFLSQSGTLDPAQPSKKLTVEGLVTGDWFGSSITPMGDLDGDGTADLAIGAMGQKDTASNENVGAVYVVFLNGDGTLRTAAPISSSSGGFTGTLELNNRFGSSLAFRAEPNQAEPVLVVGAPEDDEGVVWILFLTALTSSPSASPAVSPTASPTISTTFDTVSPTAQPTAGQTAGPTATPTTTDGLPHEGGGPTSVVAGVGVSVGLLFMVCAFTPQNTTALFTKQIVGRKLWHDDLLPTCLVIPPPPPPHKCTVPV
jgi:hypothetical protein